MAWRHQALVPTNIDWLSVSSCDIHLKVDPHYKVKVLWFSWKFGKIKKMRVWYHSHEANGVNPT